MHEPLTVTAHLANAYVASDPYSPALDGILAYWALREQLGEEEFALGMTGARPVVDADLPLGVERHGDWWWWQCSAPLMETAAEFLSYTHRRFDDHEALDVVPETVRKVLTAGGAYKEYRSGHLRRLVPALVWHCIGEAAEIRRLVARCDQIGRGHTHGYGAVRHWTVEAGGDERLARYHRPVPVDFAARHGVTGSVMTWGIRPPGRIPAHRTLCVMPT